MPDNFYTLPIPFQSLITRKEIDKCDLKTSIAQKIHLTLITAFGESRFNPEFGCEIWEFDFENIYNLEGWKDKVAKSITKAITENEKRLERIKVLVDVQSIEFTDRETNTVIDIRKRMDISLTGYLLKTNEQFYYNEPIYVSPMSID